MGYCREVLWKSLANLDTENGNISSLWITVRHYIDTVILSKHKSFVTSNYNLLAWFTHLNIIHFQILEILWYSSASSHILLNYVLIKINKIKRYKEKLKNIIYNTFFMNTYNIIVIIKWQKCCVESKQYCTVTMVGGCVTK